MRWTAMNTGANKNASQDMGLFATKGNKRKDKMIQLVDQLGEDVVANYE